MTRKFVPRTLVPEPENHEDVYAICYHAADEDEWVPLEDDFGRLYLFWHDGEAHTILNALVLSGCSDYNEGDLQVCLLHVDY